ncbi:ATP-binding protein [Arthrobacter sp. SDTb3-6]|uniref:ATP-binding protein n=1 Tax=Arthrobacter sp. SDTb3-6 TaxID=2713571 RepID=UPI00159E9434|nr:ATP-binding protein [Arthrobacter sp. SDTb3-6]NVM98528.1 ATP-binding protein [Arthrobacter sp. SDTb3-6]
MSKHVGTVGFAPAGETLGQRQARRRRERSLAASPKLSLRELRAQRAADKGEAGSAGDWGDRDGATMWGPHRAQPAPHRASTLTMAAAYPFLTESGLGPEGTYIGTDLFGSGAFCYDPWVMYDKGFISGPSIVVIGTVGTGKSMCGKSLVTRSITLGRKAAVASDPKGEWVPVANAIPGGKVISVGPGRVARVNPLDAGPRSSALTDAQWQAVVRQRRRHLLVALVSLMRPGVPLTPVEHTALDMALSDAVAANTTPTLPMVLEYLLNPTPATAALVGPNGGTGVGHSLRRTVSGDLEGMFDAPSTVAFDADAPIMVLDTSALIGASEQALSLATVCGATWLEAAVTNPGGAKRLVVYDEGWRMLADPYMLAKMSEQWRLARSYGIANLLIMHKIADLNEIGDSTSGLRQKALGLLTEADTRVIYRQKHDAMRLTKEALGLTEAECGHVENLPKGVGLWKVGNRSFIVANQVTTDELAVFGTDERML